MDRRDRVRPVLCCCATEPQTDSAARTRTALTNKAPHQPIPLFEQMIDLLMEPGARHVKFNVSPD
jgi:hypothetical protein